MSRVETAVRTFEQGFSCSQSVLSAFANPAEMSRESALRVAAGFGGGMARMGETCGAVTGAIMALGLRHGGVTAENQEAKGRTYERVRELVARFRALHGTVACRQLIGCDLSTPEGLQRAREQGLFTSLCPRFVRDAAEILEDLL